MLKKTRRRNGAHTKPGGASEILHVVGDDITAAGSHGAFQHHVVVRILQKKGRHRKWASCKCASDAISAKFVYPRIIISILGKIDKIDFFY